MGEGEERPGLKGRGAASRESASDRLVREIVRGLHEGRYAPGQRLVEADLVSAFGLSRATVREALRRLEAEGLVEISPHRGAQIRRLSPREALDAILVLRRCIALGAKQAAERIDRGENRVDLRAAWDRLAAHEAGEDGFEETRARNAFYRALMTASENRELMRIVPSVQANLIRRAFAIGRRERFADYRAIAEAALAGDVRKAEAAADAHLGKTEALVRRQLEDGES